MHKYSREHEESQRLFSGFRNKPLTIEISKTIKTYRVREIQTSIKETAPTAIKLTRYQ